MTKKRGATSDIKINEKLNMKEKKILCALLEGCANKAWPIQPISQFLKFFEMN
jgi:hypothetical protein